MIGRGSVEGFFAAFAVSAGILVVIFGWHLNPRPDTSATLAQIGATILVAYGVEASWLPKRSHIRSPNRESWVGIASSLAFCGLIGIAFAIALSSENHASQTIFQKLLLAWSIGSIALLGMFVALVPLLVYEWTHQLDSPVDDD